jgi:hypothetical protein
VSLDPALARFIDRVNHIALIDHGGRAGSNFVQCLFDSHPTVLSAPLVHYPYSYWLRFIGDRDRLPAAEAADFIIRRSYFRFVYPDAVGPVADMVSKIGGDPDDALNRPRFRAILDAALAARPEWTRRELFAVAYGAYGLAMGRDIDRVRYILTNDAVSLNHERMIDGFAGRPLDLMRADFPDGIFLALLRDPRAQFASTRHQMVNELGNNYGLRPGGVLAALARLWRDDISMDDGPAHLTLCYQVSAARALLRKWRENPSNWLFLRNEDVNTDFLPTMTALCARLGVEIDPAWRNPDYDPTMQGAIWASTGAYSSRYQKVENGPLKNDAPEVVKSTARPNRYVTERWKKRMGRGEIALLDSLFAEEMAIFGYDSPGGADSGLTALCRPFSGEAPGPGWVEAGFRAGPVEGLTRLFYYLPLPLFYLLSRWKLAVYIRRGFFRQVGPGPDRSALVRGDTSQEQGL